MRSLFQSGKQWDGIFIDGAGTGEILIEESRACGLEPGRDFHLITSDCVDGLTTHAGCEESAYTHQPTELGRQAWAMLEQLLAGKTADPLRLVPYKRYAVNSAGVPDKGAKSSDKDFSC